MDIVKIDEERSVSSFVFLFLLFSAAVTLLRRDPCRDCRRGMHVCERGKQPPSAPPNSLANHPNPNSLNRYQAMVKVGELCERWLWDYDCSLDWWSRALAMDPDRAEAGFYLGQHFRLRRGEFKKALGYLRKAFALPVPK
eukprot:1748980-Rhodomonas_salina.3